MSDTWFILIPADRNYVPAASSRRRAVELLRGFAPKAQAVRSKVTPTIEFIDCGGNWEGVACPACGADMEQWFAGELERTGAAGFCDLSAVAPCCAAKVSLDGLRFGSQVGFSRFVLETRNPSLRGAALPKMKH